MKKILIIIVILIAFFAYYVLNQKTNDEYENIYYTEENLVTQEIVEKLKIHVIGEVVNVGIYEVEEGARIDDVIKIAGGATENADLNKVNLAYEVSDGEKIYIPSIFDEEMEYTVSSENTNLNNKININKASVEELEKITGIGEALANRIVAYREENGKFSSIEDLKNVSGIGDKKFESIKEQIVVK